MNNPYSADKKEMAKRPAVTINGKKFDTYGERPIRYVNIFATTYTTTRIGKQKTLRYSGPRGSILEKIVNGKACPKQQIGTHKGELWFSQRPPTKLEYYTFRDIQIEDMPFALFGKDSLDPSWITDAKAFSWSNKTLKIKSHPYPPYYERDTKKEPNPYGNMTVEYLTGFCAFVLGEITVSFYTQQADTLEYFANSEFFPQTIVEGWVPGGYTHTILFNNGERKLEGYAQYFKTPKPIKKQYDEYMETQRRLKTAQEESVFKETLKERPESWRKAFTYHVLKTHFKSHGEKAFAKAAREAMRIDSRAAKTLETMLTDPKWKAFQKFFDEYKNDKEAKVIISSHSHSATSNL